MWSNAPPPTKAEAARIELAKTGPCMACLVRYAQGLMAKRHVIYGCEYNHAKSGNIRRGHFFGYALCQWHHQRYRSEHMTQKQMVARWGPPLHWSKRFHETFGSDDDLIAQQTYINELRAAA
ncbi:hypothetical protein JY439_02655 [Stenotrophomonas maltophilia]|nr:hypothetical protein [Stenotrophomonas maltophilia]